MARFSTVTSTATLVKVGPQGRLVIPAALRKALKVEPGTELVARIEGEQLIMERREAVERRLKHRFAHIPRSVSLADELLAERDDEVERENGN
jgi:AbrB family looped-hinge helix DNA binding protein